MQVNTMQLVSVRNAFKVNDQELLKIPNNFVLAKHESFSNGLCVFMEVNTYMRRDSKKIKTIVKFRNRAFENVMAINRNFSYFGESTVSTDGDLKTAMNVSFLEALQSSGLVGYDVRPVNVDKTLLIASIKQKFKF